jgi:putative phage-type endonuclease
MTDQFWAEHAEPAGEYTTREEWLELRGTGIGSSDCSAVLGLGKYGSPFSVWLDKTGRARPAEETEVMMWGTILEPLIRAELARRLDVQITECTTLRSRQRPWQLYNPDGLIPDLRAVVEIKNASAWLAWEWLDGEVPDHAELQVQHGMAVTGADGAYVCGLIGGNRLRYEYVPRDDRLIGIINAAEELFWHDYVLADVEPPIDGSAATAAGIDVLWPRRFDVTETVADPDRLTAIAVAADVYRAACADVKNAEADKALAVNRLAALMQGADLLLDPSGRKLLARKRGQFRERQFTEDHDGAPEWLHKVEVVDRDRLKTEEPELYRRYQSASIYIPKGN